MPRRSRTILIARGRRQAGQAGREFNLSGPEKRIALPVAWKEIFSR
jgi:hypothetical protein